MRPPCLAFLMAAVGVSTVASQPTCTHADSDLRGSYRVYMPYIGNSIACELGQGDKNDGVKALQKQINMCYGSDLDAKLAEDGDFGSKTKNAVEIVQTKSHSKKDGRYGPETRGNMNWGIKFSRDGVKCLKLLDWDKVSESHYCRRGVACP